MLPFKNKSMKTIFTFLLILSNLTLFSQVDKVAGDYTLTLGTGESHLLKYNLTLNDDGTFFFHYFSNIKNGIPREVNKYGKGKWTVENKVISFFCDKQKDLDEKHTLDFTASKARFVIKSPRDKTDQIIKTRLKFLETGIFWMERIEMFKI
jgi:hypothetical protein